MKNRPLHTFCTRGNKRLRQAVTPTRKPHLSKFCLFSRCSHTPKLRGRLVNPLKDTRGSQSSRHLQPPQKLNAHLPSSYPQVSTVKYSIQQYFSSPAVTRRRAMLPLGNKTGLAAPQITGGGVEAQAPQPTGHGLHSLRLRSTKQGENRAQTHSSAPSIRRKNAAGDFYPPKRRDQAQNELTLMAHA